MPELNPPLHRDWHEVFWGQLAAECSFYDELLQDEECSNKLSAEILKGFGSEAVMTVQEEQKAIILSLLDTPEKIAHLAGVFRMERGWLAEVLSGDAENLPSSVDRELLRRVHKSCARLTESNPLNTAQVLYERKGIEASGKDVCAAWLSGQAPVLQNRLSMSLPVGFGRKGGATDLDADSCAALLGLIISEFADILSDEAEEAPDAT